MGIYESTIQQLYVAYFNRPADTGGLAYWEGILESQNGSTAAISAAFAASSEYRDSVSGLTSIQIVNNIYQNLFGRSAEPSGLLYWALLLDQQSVNIGNIVTAIAANAQGSDADAYNNKVVAASYFTSHLDSTAEIVSYSGSLANAQAKAFLSSITTSDTLINAQYTIDATIQSIVAGKDISATRTITQTVTDFKTKPDQKIDLGNNIYVHAAVTPAHTLAGFSEKDLTYTIDKNGMITFSGNLASKLTPDMQANILEKYILATDHSHAVFFNNNGNSYIFVNNGSGSNLDHFVKVTDATLSGGSSGPSDTASGPLVKIMGINYDTGSGNGGGNGGWSYNM